MNDIYTRLAALKNAKYDVKISENNKDVLNEFQDIMAEKGIYSNEIDLINVHTANRTFHLGLQNLTPELLSKLASFKSLDLTKEFKVENISEKQKEFLDEFLTLDYPNKMNSLNMPSYLWVWRAYLDTWYKKKYDEVVSYFVNDKLPNESELINKDAEYLNSLSKNSIMDILYEAFKSMPSGINNLFDKIAAAVNRRQKIQIASYNANVHSSFQGV